MKSLLDGLPPEVAQQIDPDWQRHETAYWAVRETLLPHYRDQWIAFAHGRVLVSGTSAVEVLHAAQASGLHPFVTCVGREHEPSRMCRAVFAYDTTYPQEALPVIPVEFRTQEAVPGLVYEKVIPDTGADARALPWADCAQLALDPRQGVPGLIGGVGLCRHPRSSLLSGRLSMGRRIPVGCKRISPDTNASLGAMCSITSTSSSGDLTRKSCSIPEGVWKPCRWPACRAMQQGSTEQRSGADAP